MRYSPLLVALAFGLVPVGTSPAAAPRAAKPTPVMTAVPMIVGAPGKVVFRVTLRGGADDDEEYYCPAIEWDWDDGSVSERSRDCDPYEKGKSRIDRNFTAEHEFKLPDEYKVVFRLKKGGKVLTAPSITVTVTGVTSEGEGDEPERHVLVATARAAVRVGRAPNTRATAAALTPRAVARGRRTPAP